MLQRVEHPSASCGQPSSFAIWLQVHLHPLPRTRYRSGDDCAQDDRWREDKKVSDATLTGDQRRTPRCPRQSQSAGGLEDETIASSFCANSQNIEGSR